MGVASCESRSCSHNSAAWRLDDCHASFESGRISERKQVSNQSPATPSTCLSTKRVASLQCHGVRSKAWQPCDSRNNTRGALDNVQRSFFGFPSTKRNVSEDCTIIPRPKNYLTKQNPRKPSPTWFLGPANPPSGDCIRLLNPCKPFFRSSTPLVGTAAVVTAMISAMHCRNKCEQQQRWSSNQPAAR